MKIVAMLGVAAFMLVGCAQPYTVRTQTLEEVEQRLAAEKSAATPKLSADELAKYSEACAGAFPDAQNIRIHESAQTAGSNTVNVSLTTGWRSIVCSVNKTNMKVEKVLYAQQSLTLDEYRDLLRLAEAPAREAVKTAEKPTAPQPDRHATAKPADNDAKAILQEACNGISDSSKRLECFRAIQPAERAPASGAKVEVVRAFTDLKSILNAGTSYNSYSTQIEIAVKALGNFQSSAQTDEDKRAAAQLQESIDAHKDAQLFWQRDISWYARSSNSTAYPGGLPIEYTGTAYLVPKYGLRTQKSDFWGISTGLPRAQTLRAIWKVAEEKASAALSSLN